MKILIDMNLSPEWTTVFAAQGWEAVHWSTIGDPRAADRLVMDWARANGYTVFTHDLDFGSLLAATQAKGPSVIQVRTQDVLPSRLSGLVVRVLSEYESAIQSGVLISVDEAGSRVRLLPISLET
jgi:predicted nuclease of predicted toxin-antitoxin system